jgi:hypothetical protein
MRRALQSLALLSAGLTVLLYGAATTSADVYLPGLPEVSFRTTVTPRRLPAHQLAPVSLHLAETIANADGSHPPPLQDLRLDLDRHLGLSVKGLPSCPRSSGGRQSRQNPFESCEEAKMGSGIVELEVAFPEQAPVRISGQLNLYNGGFREGRIVFWMFVYFPAPVTGGILMPLELRQGDHGRYGWVGEIDIPKIANGAGSITYLGARFRKGIFGASCAGGQLQTGARNRFADGSVVSSTLIRTCRTAGPG